LSRRASCSTFFVVARFSPDSSTVTPRIAADEQRHIAYGTWFLRDAVANDPALAEVVRRCLLNLLPAVAESLSPPEEGAFDALGVESATLAEFGLDALKRRLAIIGVALEGSAP
jgi:ribonucleoside-diphosphate reductase beta chain